MSDEYKQEARKILEGRFGMSLEKLPIHVQPSAYAEMREIACKAKVSELEAQLRQEREANAELSRESAEWSSAAQDYRAQVAQLQTTVEQQDSLLNKISEISDQPFTEKHEHLPAWIETILKTRIAYAKQEWDEAKRGMDAAC